MSLLMPFPALRADTLRTLLVVGDDGETAVRLREALPRAMVVVLDARPGEWQEAAALCRPYPWAAVWAATAAVPERLARDRRPIILLVRAGCGDPPCGALVWVRVGELAALVQRMLDATVGGMRLAPGMGVELPGGRVVRSASLQALVSMHPCGVATPPAQFRSVASLLRASRVGWAPARRPDRTVVLVPERLPA
jgi:hypothetical protein